jgi:hypothetical protein
MLGGTCPCSASFHASDRLLRWKVDSKRPQRLDSGTLVRQDSCAPCMQLVFDLSAHAFDPLIRFTFAGRAHQDAFTLIAQCSSGEELPSTWPVDDDTYTGQREIAKVREGRRSTDSLVDRGHGRSASKVERDSEGYQRQADDQSKNFERDLPRDECQCDNSDRHPEGIPSAPGPSKE